MRPLTKSRFKLALECATKLYYTGKKDYPDKKLDDDFLQALAKGGFQVGELAKCYFPGGVNIDELDYETALAKTQTLLNHETAIIYEAAFQYKNLFIRADVVVKNGNKIQVYEVKAKSFNPNEDQFTNNAGSIKSDWKEYLYDIAFQKYVIQSSYPNLSIQAYLMLANKSVVATVDGLNQCFLLEKDERGRTRVKIKGDVSKEALGAEVLVSIPVDTIIDSVLGAELFVDNPEKSFIKWIHFYADNYEQDIRLQGPINSKCGKCEFKANPEEEAKGMKSGFKECWKKEAKFSDDDFLRPSVLEIWQSRKKDEFITQGRYFQSDITREDLEPKTAKKNAEKKSGLTITDRQELQIEKSRNNDLTPYIDIEGLRETIRSWKYPLHFIDFETTAVAIPFNANRRPYEQIAFQYSHHVVYENGIIDHKGEWLNEVRGKFPNFDFLRNLKADLETDQGSIFRYAPHENSILNAIYRQLQDSNEPDRDVLCDWIKTLTKSTGKSADKWEGPRNMIDLLEVTKSYYYHPQTKGSNSIKLVLPATINSSDLLKAKYSKPVYGTASMRSCNFVNHTWINFDASGNLINPYKTLPPIFKDIDQEILDELIMEDGADLQDGGAAMTAYAQMQFTEMSEPERKSIREALLRYCELDTLAMVMLWEAWNDWCK